MRDGHSPDIVCVLGLVFREAYCISVFLDLVVQPFLEFCPPGHSRFCRLGFYDLVKRVLPKGGGVLGNRAVPKFGTQEGFRIDSLQISRSTRFFSKC